LEPTEVVVVVRHLGIFRPALFPANFKDVLNDRFGVGVKPAPPITISGLLHAVESFCVHSELIFLLGV
jgi:hypothetical protein